MKRFWAAAVAAVFMLVALLATGFSAGAQNSAGDKLDVYTGTMSGDDVSEIVDQEPADVDAGALGSA